MANPTHPISTPSKKKPVTLSVSDVVFAGLTCLIAAIYVELFREATLAFHSGGSIPLLSLDVSALILACTAAAFAALFALALVLLRFGRPLLHFCFKWRYPIAILALIILVLCQISGSSLALWNGILDGDQASSTIDTLFGIPRAIRSDEYIVFTPLALSQEYTDYAPISDLARATPTDMTMVYAQPCWAIATLFRPFLWGYLLFGSDYGLSFFWCGRLIALFIVSFEFGRHITDDNRRIALAYALLVSFAPIVQWWFSVNGTAELLIFAQGGVLAFSAFLQSETRIRRAGFAILLAYAVGCFIMVIYPAWQVCIGYLIVGLCIVQIAQSRKRKIGIFKPNTTVKEALFQYGLPLIGALAALAVLLVIVFASSLDTIRSVSNSVYPGQRLETGGGLGNLFFDWAASWLYPIQPDAAIPNCCERASFYSLFPLGIILAIAALYEKRDAYLVALLAVEAVLLVYGVIGFPAWLAKITLLSNVTTNRLTFALGLADTMLLARSAMVSYVNAQSTTTAMSWAKSTPAQIAVAIAFALSAGAGTYALHPAISYKAFLVLCAALAGLTTYATLTFAGRNDNGKKLILAAAIIALSGLCVNPIQQGTAALAENDFLKEAASVAAEEPDSLWIGDNSQISQALIASGLPTINSVAIYPDVETWQKIDPTGEYADIYNRYAHITIVPTAEATSFELISPDSFKVKLSLEDAPTLGINYWVSTTDLAALDTHYVSISQEASNGTWGIYRITTTPLEG